MYNNFTDMKDVAPESLEILSRLDTFKVPPPVKRQAIKDIDDLSSKHNRQYSGATKGFILHLEDNWKRMYSQTA